MLTGSTARDRLAEREVVLMLIPVKVDGACASSICSAPPVGTPGPRPVTTHIIIVPASGDGIRSPVHTHISPTLVFCRERRDQLSQFQDFRSLQLFVYLSLQTSAAVYTQSDNLSLVRGGGKGSPQGASARSYTTFFRGVAGFL